MLECVEEINGSKRLRLFFQIIQQLNSAKRTQKKGTFIDHRDKELKKNYIKRHLKDLETDVYKRAGYLSLFLLWNKPTLKESMKDFNRRIKKMIGIYNID